MRITTTVMLCLIGVVSPSLAILEEDKHSGTIDATGSCAGIPTDCSAVALIDGKERLACSKPESFKHAPLFHEPVPPWSVQHAKNSAFAAESCKMNGVRCVSLNEGPMQSVWRTTSAVWDSSEQSLIMPCIVQGRLLRYSVSSGESQVEELNWPTEKSPVLIRRSHKTIAIEFGEGLIVVFHPHEPAETRNLLEAANPEWGIGAVRDWHYTQREIIAVADVAPSKCFNPRESCKVSEWKLGLVRVEHGSFKVIALIDYPSLTYDYFLLANSYIAESQGVIYVLFPGAPASIYRIPPVGRITRVFLPPSLSKNIDISNVSKSDPQLTFDYADTAVKEEGHTFPAGLIGWNNSVYLLYKTSQDGRSKWRLANLYLTRQASAEATITFHVDLPTQSSRITLIPGRKAWAILEHQPVKLKDDSIVNAPQSLKLWEYMYVEYPRHSSYF